jgi:hypothetical protein
MATTVLSNGFISLNDIINNFIISYTGPGKLIPDSKRTEVVFHARRCLQEFAYETLKSQFTKVTSIGATGAGNVGKKTVEPDSLAVISLKRSTTAGGTDYTEEMTEVSTNSGLTSTTYYIDYSVTPNIMEFQSPGLNGFGIEYNYLSNYLTTSEEAAIPKLAEEALYACMVYAILANRENTNPNLLQRLLIEKIDKLEKSKSRLVFTNFSE